MKEKQSSVGFTKWVLEIIFSKLKIKILPFNRGGHTGGYSWGLVMNITMLIQVTQGKGGSTVSII